MIACPRIVAAAFVILSFTQGVFAGDFVDVERVIKGCNDVGRLGLEPNADYEATLILGYIWGVLAGADATADLDKTAMCTPGRDVIQACEALAQWVTRYPETSKQPGAITLIRALRESYSCAATRHN